MVRAVVLALTALGVAAGFIFWRSRPSSMEPAPTDAAPDVQDAPRLPPVALATPPMRTGSVPTPAAASELPASPPAAPRRMVRARLLAVDAARNEPVDPHAAFSWVFAEGCDEQEVATETGPGARQVAALLPAGADASKIRVSIDGWGFLPYVRSFPLRAQEGAAVEEIRVPLEPVDAAAWSTVRVVLAGPGGAVTEAESLRLFAMPRTAPHAQPRLAIEFTPGSAHEREILLPFPAEELVLETSSRVLVDGGRRIWSSRPLVRVESAIASGSTPVTFSLTRLPTAILELDLRYPDGDRPRQLDCWGSWRETATDVVGAPRRNLMSTFNVTVDGAPDIVRLERYAGQLSGLTGRAFGFVATVTPSGPLELRLSETTHAVVEFRRAPIPPPK